MEASGLSDTTSVSEVLSVGNIGEKIYLASNWCVVDALNFNKTGLMKQRVSHQLRMADFVIVNKTDLIKENTDSIYVEIKKINPFAKIYSSEYCNVDFEEGTHPFNKFYLSRVESLDRPEVKSMVIKSSRKISPSSFQNFIEEWAKKAYRIKGFVNLDSGETMAVQSILGEYILKPVGQFYHSTELIAITTEFTLKEWHQSFKEFSNR